MQEVALASSNTCLLGKHEFKLLELLRLAGYVSKRVRPVDQNPATTDTNVFLWWILLEPSIITHCPFSDNIADLSSYAQGRAVTDERDRVYGVLGLLTTSIPQDLAPDYNKSAIDVLLTWTRHCLLRGSYFNCDILRLVVHRNVADLNSQTRPSWLPNSHVPRGPPNEFLQENVPNDTIPERYRILNQNETVSARTNVELTPTLRNAVLHPNNIREVSDASISSLALPQQHSDASATIRLL